MQEITDLWHRVTSWIASLDLSRLRLSDIGTSAGDSLQDFALWLNTGYRGMTIALILLVIIVNRILKRPH